MRGVGRGIYTPPRPPFRLLPTYSQITNHKSQLKTHNSHHNISLPPCITERCKIDSRPLIDLIRTEVYKVNDQSPKTPSKLSAAGSWLERVHTCPQGLIDMLNSRACRSAIMFNDELSADQCQRLVQKLSRCLFPFQCAHGRPSLVPLVGLGDSMGGGLRGTGALLPRETDEAPGFGQAFAGMRGRINKGRG